MAVSLGFLPTADDQGGASTASRRRRAPLGVLSWTALVSAVVVPLADRDLPVVEGFAAVAVAVAACLQALSVLVLLGAYLDEGDPRVLATGAGFLWSAVALVGHGAASAASSRSAPVLLVAGLAGLSLLTGAAWGPWGAAWETPTAPERRGALAARGGVAALVLSMGATALLVLAPAPGGDALAVVSVAVAVVGLGLAWRAPELTPGPERWALLTAGGGVLSVLLLAVGDEPYTLGWYAARLVAVPAAGAILVAVLAGFRRLRADAEFLAGHDGLTGLANRRSALTHLDQLVARARRSSLPVSVVLVDVDDLPHEPPVSSLAVEDRLTAVGAVVAKAVRAGDLVARYGDAVLLVLLPDTDEPGARAVVRKLSGLVGQAPAPQGEAPLTATFGTGSLQPDDEVASSLLGRAEHALYRARFAGRVPAAG